MKIAVLSDIHGNHLALKLVLDEARILGIERLFILGDIVGYYYHPDAVIELLKDWPKEMIQGNHEGMLKDAEEDFSTADAIRNKYGSGIDFALKKLSKQWIKELTELPSRMTRCIDGLQFELCHGSPWERDHYVYPDTHKDILDKCLISGADFVFLGHTHRPFFYQKDNTSVVNVGSVGQSRDRGSIANWAFVDTDNRTLVFKNTFYDSSSIIEEVKKNDPLLPYLYEFFLRK